MYRYAALIIPIVFWSLPSFADSCSDASIRANPLKRKLVYTSELVQEDNGSNLKRSMEQFEKLTDDLSLAHELVDISENQLKYCMGKSFLIKEIYSFEDKTSAMLTIAGFQGVKTFYYNYMEKSDNWTEATNMLISDIEKKRALLKNSIVSLSEKKLAIEKEKSKKLEQEKSELSQMQALIDVANQQAEENRQSQEEIRKQKAALSHSNKASTSQKSSNYREGQTSAYLQKDSIFCLTEKQFDYQMSLIADNVNKGVGGCFLSSFDIDVIVEDFGMLGKTNVIAVSTGQSLWINTESLNYR